MPVACQPEALNSSEPKLAERSFEVCRSAGPLVAELAERYSSAAPEHSADLEDSSRALAGHSPRTSFSILQSRPGWPERADPVVQVDIARVESRKPMAKRCFQIQRLEIPVWLTATLLKQPQSETSGEQVCVSS